MRVCTFPADVISRTEKDVSQPEHEFAQEAGLGVLEDLDPLQRVQVDVNSYLGLQSVRQAADGPLLVRTFLGHPQVVEPPDHLVFDVVGHTTHAHVRLRGIQTCCKKIISD
ncbi:hypothetical protein TNCT_208171 [Trichonephila clavata]|uniref:Uncharacterized protein n=1 Tax=Trichonephila clavata TaxID=2740835 RepID=A0A8X6JKN9_TRICU|nr:hypothetical protein TNCT_208171 [Trichonephila clavata]